MVVLGSLVFMVVGYSFNFAVFWQNIHHLRVKAQM